MDGKRRLAVVWVTGDREAALNMVFMYAGNSKRRGWWDEVRLVVWGPSARLLAEDAELQEALGEVSQAGVELFACKACSDFYGVSEKLQALGIRVILMGVPFTQMLQGGWTCLTV